VSSSFKYSKPPDGELERGFRSDGSFRNAGRGEADADGDAAMLDMFGDEGAEEKSDSATNSDDGGAAGDAISVVGRLRPEMESHLICVS
jgi:hypothetical protein